MNEWWNGLDALNKAFYIGAGFFSLIFLWQFLASLIGMAGEGADVDVDADMDVDGLDLDDIEAGAIEEAGETVAAFNVLSLRAILAFCTLFCWAAALYLDRDLARSKALVYAFFWGLAGWAVVAALVYGIRRLAETGNPRLATCVGTRGTVYLNIPEHGEGQIRITVSGVVSRVKARSTDGGAIQSGVPVRVARTLDANTVEVEAIQVRDEQKGSE